MSYRRAKAMEDTSSAHAKANENASLESAVQHLGHASASVRLAGVHEAGSLGEERKRVARARSKYTMFPYPSSDKKKMRTRGDTKKHPRKKFKAC